METKIIFEKAGGREGAMKRRPIMIPIAPPIEQNVMDFHSTLTYLICDIS